MGIPTKKGSIFLNPVHGRLDPSIQLNMRGLPSDHEVQH